MGGGHHVNPEAMPRMDQNLAEMEATRMPLPYRDTCGHLLTKLNKCRRETAFMPWKCGHERHTFEECEYIAWNQRVAMKTEENKK